MYKGINLQLDNWEKNGFYHKCYDLGKLILNSDKKQIETTLKSFKNPNGSLNGSRMGANWFPKIKADAFISHSHKDEDIAIAFAGLLFKNFNIKCFIDSCVWGYSDELLKLIDKQYCWNEENGTYYYQSRNYSTSHVHMMLSVALTTMIDNAECLFFLNTPNSITPSGVVSKTISPWIFSELAITKLLRKKTREEHRKLEKALTNFSESKKYGFPKVEYDIDLDHLLQMDFDLLKTWINSIKTDDPHESLDCLYQLFY